MKIPFSPTGISINTIGLIVPATAIELTPPPLPAVIVTPLIVTVPVWISTSWTCFTPSTSVIELGSFTLTPKFACVPVTLFSPIETSTAVFSTFSPDIFSNLPSLRLKFPPLAILAVPLVANAVYLAPVLYKSLKFVFVFQSGPKTEFNNFFNSGCFSATILKASTLYLLKLWFIIAS